MTCLSLIILALIFGLRIFVLPALLRPRRDPPGVSRRG